jgi:hypothetical protein
LTELGILERILASEITKTKQKPIDILVLSKILRPTKTIKSLEEVQAKDTKVQAKIIDIKVKRQRGHNEGTEARQAMFCD